MEKIESQNQSNRRCTKGTKHQGLCNDSQRG